MYQNNEMLNTACGSPCYAAPEMVARKQYHGVKIDIWSAGVTLFAMLNGHLPFDDDDLATLYKKILSGKYEIGSKLSNEACDLISKMLRVNPDERIGIEEIKIHPWMKMRFLHRFGKKKKDGNKLNEAIVKKFEELGVSREFLLENLNNNRHNMLTTTYYLLENQARAAKRLKNEN